MSTRELIAAYNATDEAADGLALAHLLAERLDCEVMVARVVTSGGSPIVTDRARQLAIRGMVEDTRSALVAAIPAEAAADITPVVDASMAHGLHDLARVEDAEAIVVGSSHHHGLGRLLLGGGPELVANGSPCPVFVAPPGFREGGRLRTGEIVAAFDNTPAARHALRYATTLAERFGAQIRVVTVHPTGLSRQIGGGPDVAAALAEAEALVKECSDGRLVPTTHELRGEPAHELAREADGGLLVLGSRNHGAIKRVLLGSVSAAALRAAHGPAVVVAAP